MAVDGHLTARVGRSRGENGEGAVPEPAGRGVSPANLERLVGEVNAEYKRVVAFEKYSKLPAGVLSLPHPNGREPRDPPVKGGVAPPQSHPSPMNPTASPAPWDSYVQAATCLVNGTWTTSFFHVEVCVDRACADLLQNTLVGSDVQSFAFAFAQLIYKVITTSSWLGWVGFGLAAAEFWWGLMIALNKTPRGVCLIIPTPNTLGLAGPGWATGRR